MSLSVKVLIIGGGPAGATAAKVLARSGSDVILLERNLSHAKPCGGGLSLSAFDELGIPKTLIKKEVGSIRIISPNGEKVDIDLKGGNLAIVERQEFDNTLRKQAEAEGVNVIEGEFINLNGHKKYTVEANVLGSKTEIISEYVIAADGVNSKVRAVLGLKPVQSFYTESERINGLNSDLSEFWFGSSHAPYSYSWVFPAAEGISIGTGTFDSKKIKDLLEKFKTRKGISSAGRKSIYRIPAWKGDIYNIDKILFAGDSAGQVLPLTYEGLYYAMKAGEYAANAILSEKVHIYKKMWKAQFQKRFMLMDVLRNYFLKNNESAERLVALHRRPEIQEVSLRLWLRKDSRKESLTGYIKLFRNFLD